MRRRRLIASVVIPGLVTGLAMFSSPASAATPPLDATKVKVSATPEIPVGFGAGAAGNIVLGDSTVQFQAGDSLDAVVFGDRARLERTGRRPADQTERKRSAPFGSKPVRSDPSAGRRWQRPGRSRSLY